MRHYQRGIATTVVLLIFLLAGIAIASGAFIFSQKQQKSKQINSFEDCAKHYPVMESYPEQCNTPDGKHFTRELNKDKSSEELESLNNKAYIYDGEYFEGIFYKFKYPPNYKAKSGAYGCNPIIIEPVDESINGKICVVEDSFENNDLDNLLVMGYGEELLSREDINVKGREGIIIETKRDRASIISVTAAVKNVPLFLRGMKPKKTTGILLFSYDLTDINDKVEAKQALEQILDSLEISE